MEIVLLFQNSLTVCMATSTGPSTTTSQQQLWCLYPDGKFIKLMCCLLDVYPVYVFVIFTISVFTELCDCRGLWFYRSKWNMQWQTPIILKGNWVCIFILAWRALHQKVVASAAFGEIPLEVCFLSFFYFTFLNLHSNFCCAVTITLYKPLKLQWSKTWLFLWVWENVLFT